MIKTAIRCPNNMVIVFDEMGTQIPEYHGQYEEVKENILKDAPPKVVFRHLLSYEVNLKSVPREEW
jgi:hypothetical protein